ncbi:uncharacterized protein LOC135842076 [Planococcus citri]|uniref:uncharacterized protein LOC135842076 n=1 Tax=Planococcus citri TaxID=170843 RepID=UPI0031F9F601
MIFTKGLFLVVVFLIHTTSAINLNFFNFNKSPDQNETTATIPIEPTKSISSSIEVTESSTPTPVLNTLPEITESPIPVLNHSPAIITESPITVVNYSPPDSNVNLVILQKHEFENETEAVDASPEITDNNNKPSVPNRPDVQEIDETRNSSVYNYSVNETILEELEDIFNDTIMTTTPTSQPTPDLPNSPKIFLPSFTLPKRKTVQFTHTIVTTITKLETVYPSCVKMENVRSVCDGSLISIQPTPTLFNHADLNTQMANINNDDNFDIIEPPESRKKRSQDSTITLKNLKESESKLRVDFIEPSESDYEFEVLPPGVENKQKNSSDNLQGRGPNDATQPLAIIESLLLNKPKVEFFTAYLATTSVRTITNNAVTATVIARNCIPKNMNLKRCPISTEFETKAPIRPIKPIVDKPENTKSPTKQHKEAETKQKPTPVVNKPAEHTKSTTKQQHKEAETEKKPILVVCKQENTKSTTKQHKQAEAEEKFISIKPKPSTNKPPVLLPPQQKPFDALEQLREYLIMNANRLFNDKPNSYEIIDLNAGSTIIQSADTALSPIYYKKRSIRVKRQR